MLKFRLGCYKSYPLTRISSRDSGLASKEIRIGLEFKNRVLQLLPPYWNLVSRFWLSSSAPLLGMVTPLHCARLDLLVPSNSLRRLQNLHRMLGVGQISCTSNPSNGAYSSGTLKHFFNSDLHNTSASSERFSNSPVLSLGRGVTTPTAFRDRSTSSAKYSLNQRLDIHQFRNFCIEF